MEPGGTTNLTNNNSPVQTLKNDVPLTSPANTKRKSSESTHKNVYLVHKEDELQCHFWIGLFRPGNKSPSDLLSYGKADTVLEAAIKEGLNEKESVMIVDTNGKHQHVSFYAHTNSEQPGNSSWINNAHSTISSWSPEAIGFYFSPELVDKQAANDLLFGLLSLCIETNVASTYNLLIGSHGINTILNAALRIKSKLEHSSAAQQLSIYH